MTNFPENWADIAWAKLTLAQRQRAVDILRRVPGWDDFAEIAREGYDKHGSDFVHKPPLSQPMKVMGPEGEEVAIPMPWHMSGGMAVRNHLRKQGFVDDFLPKLPEVYDGQAVSTWDDFYVQVVEAAIGVRPVTYAFVGGTRTPVYAKATKLSLGQRLRGILSNLVRP